MCLYVHVKRDKNAVMQYVQKIALKILNIWLILRLNMCYNYSVLKGRLIKNFIDRTYKCTGKEVIMTRTERTDFVNRTITFITYKVIAVDTDDNPIVFTLTLPELAPKTTKSGIEGACLKKHVILAKYLEVGRVDKMVRMSIIDFCSHGTVADTDDTTKGDTAKG